MPEWMAVGFELFAALSPLGRWSRTAPTARSRARSAPSAMRSGRVFETYPDAIFCALLGHRPPPKRTPWGGQQRIAALKLKGVYDDDGGLWHRTLDEIDACAAAYAAYALSVGLGTWVGDPAEGVMVIPTAHLLPTLHEAARARRAPSWPDSAAYNGCGWRTARQRTLQRAGAAAGLLHRRLARRATISPS